jgi:hypothetical protein
MSRLYFSMEGRERIMHLHTGPFTVIQAGTTQLAIIKIESQRPDQVQGAAGVGTKAYYVTGIGRYLRLKQHDMKHSGTCGK